MKHSPAAVAAVIPGSLLSQYKLLCAVIDSPWATRLDHKITRHVIDRYYGKFGNARASLRYLERATGSARNSIIESLRRVINHGVFTVIRPGAGTRPTEYGLNFEFGSSGSLGLTATSGEVQLTTGGEPQLTSNDASGSLGLTESYLRSDLTRSLTIDRIENTHPTASPPPVGGPEATTAGMARDPEKIADPFEELWAVYPRKQQRAKAKAAYKELRPSPELHADLVAQASAWAAHYDTTATEKKWWKHLHTWLAGECYLEDLPVPYENPKEAAIARARENGPRKGKPQPAAKETGLSPKTPIGRHKVKIIGSELTGDSFTPERRFTFSFRIDEGERESTEFSHAFKYFSADDSAQTEGQDLWAQLRQATGIQQPDETSDLHGLPLLAIVGKMGRIEYAAI